MKGIPAGTAFARGLVASALMILVALPAGRAWAGEVSTKQPLSDLGRIFDATPGLPPLHRDAGMNLRLDDGRRLWLFGDTLNGPGGLQSSTAATSASGSTSVTDVLSNGNLVQTVPYTASELLFNAQPDNVAVGRRIALWPAGGANLGGGDVLVFYGQVTVNNDWAQWVEGPTGVGIAHYQAGQPLVVSRVNNDLFGASEGFRGTFFAAPDGYVYGYDCDIYVGCRVARAPLASATTRSAWRFWNGSGWSTSIGAAALMWMTDPEANVTGTLARFPNSGNVSVAWSSSLGSYVMSYMGWPGLGDAAQVRTAPNPWGPWSPPTQHRLLGCAGFNCYWPIVHPDLSSSTRIGLSYFRPAEPNPGGIDGALRVEQLTTARAMANPFGNLEAANATPGAVHVAGWALDPDTADPIQVRVTVDGVSKGEFAASSSRPDVAGVFPGYGVSHGFDLSLSGLSVGTAHQVCVYGIDEGPGTTSLVGCQVASPPSGNPIGNLEVASPAPGSVHLAGWALDPDTVASIKVRAYVDGAWKGDFDAAASRPDVASAFPGFGESHGFDLSVGGLAGGPHQVCVYGLDVAPGANALLGCRQVEDPTGPPIGNLDAASAAPGSVHVTGWALDPDTAASIKVHVYVDGGWGGEFDAALPRPDVAAAFVGYGPDHGFDLSVGGLSAGTHQVCVYGINVGPGGTNPLLGCRTVSPPSGSPFGNVDVLTTAPGSVHVAGWALDPDTTASIKVHVYVDGGWGGEFDAALPRPDVAAAFVGYGPDHGFDLSVGGLSAGTHQVCVYGINVGAGGTNSLIGCRTG